eukprot:Polyplicarium_translucidae@DN3344_c0_g1_i1.p1
MSRLSRRQFLAALYDEATPLSAPQLEKWKALWAADPLGAYLGAQDDPGFPTYEATSPPAGLLALPVDLLRYVVQYLSHRDLHGFLSVCRSAADCTSRLKQSDVTLAVLRPDVGLAPQEMFRSHWQRERAAELHGFYFSDGDDTRQGDLVLAPHIRSVLTSRLQRTARLQRFFSTSAPFLVELYVFEDYHVGPAFDDFVGRHWDTLKIIVAPVRKMRSTAAFGKAQGLRRIAFRCFSRMPFACIEWVDGTRAGAPQTADLLAVKVAASHHVRNEFVDLVATPRIFEAAEIVSNIRALVLPRLTACEALSALAQLHLRLRYLGTGPCCGSSCDPLWDLRAHEVLEGLTRVDVVVPYRSIPPKVCDRLVKNLKSSFHLHGDYWRREPLRATTDPRDIASEAMAERNASASRLWAWHPTDPQCIHRRVFARIIESKEYGFTEFSWIAKECACSLAWFDCEGHLSSPEATATQRLAFQERLQSSDTWEAVWEEVREWMTEFITYPRRTDLPHQGLS